MTPLIADILEKLLAHKRLVTRQQARLHALGAVGVSLALALVFSHFGWPRFGLVMALLGVVVGLGLIGYGFWQLSKLTAETAKAWSARLAETLAPELGTSPSSAVDLSARLSQSEIPFSRELAESHVERTGEALKQVDFEKRLRAHEHERRQRARWVALGGVMLGGLALVSMGAARTRLWTLLKDPQAAELVDVPLAGDLRITYRFPAYTNQPPRVVQGGDGSIAAVAGTQVELSATAEEPVRKASLKIERTDGQAAQDVPLNVSDGRTLTGSFTLTHDGRYHFALTNDDGDRLEERQKHSLRAIPDAYPEVTLNVPAQDIELRDNQPLAVGYSAKDDFGLSEVNIVVELAGEKEPRKLQIAGGKEVLAEREGLSRYALTELGLTPGAEGRLYIEAVDNDAINGPKRAVSQSRKLSLFSAQKHHEGILKKQEEAVRALVSQLGQELETPMPQMGNEQKRVTAAMTVSMQMLNELVPLLHDDKLSGPQIAAAFDNVLQHVRKMTRERTQLVQRLDATTQKTALLNQGAREQKAAVTQLENDIIYLDDLLAIQRIDELKQTAKDLLSAQRELQSLMQKYKETKDPALKAELEQRIKALKDEMMQLLARMSEIKDQLPGEYRNMEAATQMQVGEQLDKLEKALKDGDLDAAAQELEQLANMIENMQDRIGEAEEEYGGERYDEMRKDLADFAQEFQKLEAEQQALAKKQEQLLKQYRDKAVQQAGKNMEDVVKQAREKTAEALRELDNLGDMEGMYGVEEAAQAARQRLMDLDSLLAQKDFSEARESVDDALRQENALQMSLDMQSGRYGLSKNRPDLQSAGKASERAQKKTREVQEMLDKMFPSAEDVLSKEQQQQMRDAAKQQAQLEQKAQQLGQKMEQMASEVPLFGGEPKANLDGARAEMGQASKDLQEGQVPGGAQHGKRAADQLSKLRQSLEQASKGGKGGLPLPLGGQGGPGGKDGQGEMNPNEDVRIPGEDKKGAPRFRQDLMEAAKQKAPENYEEAVRKYYEELIK